MEDEDYDQGAPHLEEIMRAILFTIPGDPIGKPRMTQADKWRRRPCVLAYRAWADKARYAVRAAPSSIGFHNGGQFVAGLYDVSWIAFIAMPASWSKKKKDALRGKLHFGKPDRDNIDKAILDALFPDDRGVATGALAKRWDDGIGPRIELVVTKLEGVMP